MQINIKYLNRELKFEVVEKEKISSGEGMNELLRSIESYESSVEAVYIDGQSGSYTFNRQIYLLINMLNYLTDATVYLNGERINHRELVLPKYN